MQPDPEDTPPRAVRIGDGLVLGFAGWTLLTNAVVFAGGSLDALMASAVVAAGAAIIAHHVRVTRPIVRPAPLMDPAGDDAPPARGWILLGLGLAATAVVARFGFGSLTGFCLIGLAAAGLAFGRSIRETPVVTPAASARSHAWLLGGLALLSAIATAIAHRADADDAFYLNIVVAAVDDPAAALLAGDTLHGYADIPMSLPVFRVLSWEMLQSTISRLGGIDAITLVHIVMPPIVAALVPLAYARLLRLLAPDRWPVALVLVMAQLMLVGDGTTGYGDFALLRMHQGKALMLHIGLPLLASYALEFAAAPSRARWLRLAAANIGVVGFSSSGLWLAPACTGLALAAATPLRRANADDARPGPIATLCTGMAACFHPLLLALALRAETTRAFRDALHRIGSLDWSSARLMEHSLDSMLGAGPAAGLALFVLVAVGLCAMGGLLRRYAAVTTLAFFLLFWSPWSAHFVANHVAGPDTYFRVFWLLPLPVFIACLLSLPLAHPSLRTGSARSFATATILVASLVLFALTARYPTLSTRNGVRIAAPGPKVAPAELAIARIVAQHAGPGDFVVAPPRIARWLPLLHHHPSPLMVREMYLDLLRERFGPAELDQRKTLTYMVGGRARLESHGGALLAEAIDRYPLAVVCLGGPATGWPELRRILIDSELEPVFRDADYVVWARPPGVTHSR